MYEDLRQSAYEDLAHMELNGSSENREPEKSKKENKKKHPVLKSVGCGMLFGLCAGVVFSGVTYVSRNTFLVKEQTEASAMDKEQSGEEVTIENTDTIKQENTGLQVSGETATDTVSTVSQIARNCMPSVVAITSRSVEEIRSMFGTQQYENEGAGSGIIVGQNDKELLIATNNHVVAGATELSVCFNDSEEAVVEAKIKGTDASNDLAIIAVELSDMSVGIRESIKVATLGDSRQLHVGDQVVAIGNALGYGQSVTTGIVSALNREVSIDEISSNLIQTDAAINPGNSGGALLNMKGELIGINSAKFASEEVEGMGYAIPLAVAQPILDNLMNRETREEVDEKEAGYLGVSVQDVSQEASEYYGIPQGAYIADTEHGGAADSADIKKGDIIIRFDGLTISNATELKNTLAYYKQGETVEVVYARSNNGAYEEKTVSVTLSKSKAVEEDRRQELEENAKKGLQIPGSGDSDEESYVPETGFEDFFNFFFGN